MFEAQLRLTLLASRDVAPEALSKYLLSAARHGSHRAKTQLWAHAATLIEHSPSEFVDFALELLLQRVKRRDSSIAGPDPDPEDELETAGDFDEDILGGIHRSNQPPSHKRGPFLNLLERDEAQGLRLIWTYTNTLTDRWRAAQTHPEGFRRGHRKPARTPFPLTLQLPGGAQEFWGDASVYGWFRPNDRTPPLLCSALMALEFWIEQQIARGRAPQPLVEGVLSGSRCVAVAGLCFGVLLPCPEDGLPFLLPFVTQPLFWQLDTARGTNDKALQMLRGESIAPPSTWAHQGQATPADQAEREAALALRERRPQRFMDVRNVATRMAFAPDELRLPFESAVRLFPSRLPFAFAEDANDESEVSHLQEQMQTFAVFAERSNYQFWRDEHGQAWIDVPLPPAIEAKRREFSSWLFQGQAEAQLSSWARQSMEEGRPAAGRTLEEAIRAAQAVQQPDDFTFAYEWRRDAVNYRHEAVADVAAVAVALEWSWLQQSGYASWCMDVLSKAVDAPLPQDSHSKRPFVFMHDPKVAAARALSALVVQGHAAGPEGRRVRKYLGRLCCLGFAEITRPLLQGLAGAWEKDPVLCWNLVALCLSLCVTPRHGNGDDEDAPSFRGGEQSKARSDSRFQNMIDAVQEDVPIPLPLLPRASPARSSDFRSGHFGVVLPELATPTILQGEQNRQRTLQLLSELMQWTLRANTPRPGDDRYAPTRVPMQWNRLFGRWCAGVAEALAEEVLAPGASAASSASHDLSAARSHVLSPVLEAWTFAPQIADDLLGGIQWRWMATTAPPSPASQILWREVSVEVLRQEDVLRTHPSSRRRDVQDALSRIVFVSCGSVILGREWPHPAFFPDVVDAWVAAVGHEPDSFGDLLRMLSTFAEQMEPPQVVRWLDHCVSKAPNTQQMLRHEHNGHQAARILAALWSRQKVAIQADKVAFAAFCSLIDDLTLSGEAVAGFLQAEVNAVSPDRDV